MSLVAYDSGGISSAIQNLAFGAGEDFSIAVNYSPTRNITGRTHRATLSEFPGGPALVDVEVDATDATTGAMLLAISHVKGANLKTWKYWLEIRRDDDGHNTVVTRAWADVTGNALSDTSQSLPAGFQVSWADVINKPASFPIGGTAGGDLTGSYPNPDLVPSGVDSGAYGAADSVAVVEFDAKGRATAAVSVPILITQSQVSGLTSALAGKLPSAGGTLTGNLRFGATGPAGSSLYILDGSGVNSIRPGGRQLLNSSNHPTVDWESRSLNDAAGATIIGWAGGAIFDATQNTSIDFFNRKLYDQTEVATVDWHAQILYDQNNGVNAIDWLDYAIRDGAGFLVMDWGARTLYATDGSTPAIDWSGANVSINGRKLTNVTDPTSANDAATKGYVDAVAAGQDVKASCVAATTANITLSGTQTIDGVILGTGNRVLVKNQSTGSQNGIYIVASGAWTRATDADANAEVTPGLFTFIEQGTVNGGTGWTLTTPSPIAVGTTALTFTQFCGPGTYSPGSGLALNGMQFYIPNGAITNGMLASPPLKGSANFDFGSPPGSPDSVTVTVSDPSVTASSVVSTHVQPGSGRDEDEMEMEHFAVAVYLTAGVGFDIVLTCLSGGGEGVYTVNYSRAA